MSANRVDWIDAAVAGSLVLTAACVAALGAMEDRAGSEEAAAIVALRSLASCQVQVQTARRINADGDERGEYGTLAELAGLAGVRNGLRAGRGRPGEEIYIPLASDFSRMGSLIAPRILPAGFEEPDGNGFSVRGGYAFTVFLPDGAVPAGFVRETGPASRMGLAGGSGAVGVELSETVWCAYAQPVTRGENGTRRFFVDQSGEVLQSANAAAVGGVSNPVRGDSAFLGSGITSKVAVGTRGRDGDVWKYVN